MESNVKLRRVAVVLEKRCVGCGCCEKVCPKGAIGVKNGVFAAVDRARCVGCGLCAKECPASVIQMEGTR